MEDGDLVRICAARALAGHHIAEFVDAVPAQLARLDQLDQREGCRFDVVVLFLNLAADHEPVRAQENLRIHLRERPHAGVMRALVEPFEREERLPVARRGDDDVHAGHRLLRRLDRAHVHPDFARRLVAEAPAPLGVTAIDDHLVQIANRLGALEQADRVGTRCRSCPPCAHQDAPCA